MKKKLLTMAAAVLLISGLTSCVYDRDSEEVVTPGGSSLLVINVNSTPVGEKTRATVITDGTDATRATAEKTITTMVVNVYSSDGTVKKDAMYLTGLTGEASSGWATVTEHKNLANSLAAGDLVLIACNVNSTVATALNAAATPTAFRAVLSTIDQSLIFADSYSASQTIAANKLPMYGCGTTTVASDNAANFEVDVNVMHMVSKVTLNALTLSGASGCSFTPTSVFLINVPEKLDFTFGTEGDESTYGFSGLTTHFFQGESAAVAASTNVTTNSLTTRQFRDYLGTGALTVSAVDATNPLASTYTFYTMPNNDATNDTRLVIAGTWNDGSVDTDCWYVIQLNNVGANAALSLGLYPNRHYVVDVDIRRIGALLVTDDATGAYNTLQTQNSVRATINVTNWSDGSKSTTFGANGGNASES